MNHLVTLALIVVLACISPGPDFIAVTSNALRSRARGLAVARGVMIACSIWAALAMFGLSVVLSRISWLYDAVRLAGAAYLLYLGARLLLASRKVYRPLQVNAADDRDRSGLLTGLLVGMTNPKSAAFFGSLFVTILPVDAPAAIRGAAVAIVAAVAFCWFTVLALMFSGSRMRTAYAALRRPLDAIMGVVLMGLAAHLAVSR